MKGMNIQELDAMFERYGYELNEYDDSYRVYLLHHGMYYGAEIVVLDNSDKKAVRNRFSELGYSAKLQHFKSVLEAEEYLFKGFFKTESTKLSIKRRYESFAKNQMKPYVGLNLKYEYIDVPYDMFTIDSDEGEMGTNIIESIHNIINKPGAHLIIIEAAAGFGKTCTAFELYNSFQRFSDTTKPLFAELSRNRTAKIFKYVLLSEIDNEYKTSISNDLVTYNIMKGRIPLIIDGFDELLSKDIDTSSSDALNEYEQVETMLSTIGALLRENAKIVLTSRRTAIFTGSEFGEWVSGYDGLFDVVRFQLRKPDISHWLRDGRYDIIISQKIPMTHISNPVLLTYLRNVDDDAFLNLIKQPDAIIDKYFEFLLTREQERQNLIIPHKDQLIVFENLAKSFTEFNITSEQRSFITELIVEYNRELLRKYRDIMPQKQTIDDIADTLTNHALLDRIGNADNIGFVNDFVFGFLLGKYILENSISFLLQETIIPEDLLELAILTFRYSDKESKIKLWENLESLKNCMSVEHNLLLDSLLVGIIKGKYELGTISSFVFEGVVFDGKDCEIKSITFIDTQFDRCTFNTNAFDNVNFISCIFNECQIVDSSNLNGRHQIYCYACEDYSSDFINLFETKKTTTIQSDDLHSLESQILSKYFKVDGRSTKMKYISQLRSEFISSLGNEYESEVNDTFEKLRKEGFLQTHGNNSFITQKGITHYHKNCKI